MTVDDLKEEIIRTDDEILADMLPNGYGRRKNGLMKLVRPAVILPVIGLLILAGIWLPRLLTPAVKTKAETLAEAEYPQMAQGEQIYLSSWEQYSTMTPAEREALDNSYYQAQEANWKRMQEYGGNGETVKPFLQRVITSCLKQADGKNALSAPLNLYFALAMLSEAAGGESRQELLSALGASDIETLREQTRKIWLANYYDTGQARCILSNSLWLSNSLKYHENCVNTLAGSYFASIYRGEMGSSEYGRLFRDWIDAQTGDLLTEYTPELSLEKDSVMTLVSTVLFQDRWKDEFDKSMATEGSFSAPDGERTVTYLHQTEPYGIYYWGVHFGAYAKACEDSGASVWFILPDEGVSMETLLDDPELQAFLMSPMNAQYKCLRVNFTMPKFDISLETDLTALLKELGIENQLRLKLL